MFKNFAKYRTAAFEKLSQYRSVAVSVGACGITWLVLNYAPPLAPFVTPIINTITDTINNTTTEPTPTPDTCPPLQWTVPDGVRSVNVRIKEPNGQTKNSYTITDYISMEPGQTVELIPNC
jgi:hypothetical protein